MLVKGKLLLSPEYLPSKLLRKMDHVGRNACFVPRYIYIYISAILEGLIMHDKSCKSSDCLDSYIKSLPSKLILDLNICHFKYDAIEAFFFKFLEYKFSKSDDRGKELIQVSFQKQIF